MNQNMKRLNLNFAMARYFREDQILRAIAEEALNFLLERVDANKIQCLLLTGSVANGEGTVIEHDSIRITSDFDFVVYLDLPYFLKYSGHFQSLSQEISAIVSKRGVDTHIQFLPSSNIIRIFPSFANPRIYEYEFAFATKCILGKKPPFNKVVRPSRRDALELIFTVVSDLVFSKFKESSKIEESYIYAKRVLTLLNSILIFRGFFAETYKKRIDIAKKYGSIGTIPFSREEVKTLEIFTEYKLSGSYRHLLNSLAYKDVDDLVQFQKKFLTILTAKVLCYELINLTNKQLATNLARNNCLQNPIDKLPKLLREYSKHSMIRTLSRIMGITIYMFGLLAGDRKRTELFATFIFHKQSPKVILNVLVALLFIYGLDISARKILNEIFPWIDLDDETEAEAFQRIFSLWQIAEQSVKL